MAKHTPGPWRVCRAIKAGEFDIRDEHSSGGYAPIAKVKGDKRSTAAQTIENARLIAAAPDLLEVLVTMPQGISSSDQDWWDWIDKARSAIDKATGESK